MRMAPASRARSIANASSASHAPTPGAGLTTSSSVRVRPVALRAGRVLEPERVAALAQPDVEGDRGAAPRAGVGRDRMGWRNWRRGCGHRAVDGATFDHDTGGDAGRCEAKAFASTEANA